MTYSIVLSTHLEESERTKCSRATEIKWRQRVSREKGLAGSDTGRFAVAFHSADKHVNGDDGFAANGNPVGVQPLVSPTAGVHSEDPLTTR